MRLRRYLVVMLAVAAATALAPASSVTPRGAVAHAAPLPLAAPSRTFARTGSTCWNTKPAETAFKRKMNSARAAAGVRSLQMDPQLSRAARYHTWRMLRQDLLHHTPSDILRRRVTRWVVLGENVGVGGDVDVLHQAFMNSPAHKANIVLPGFAYVGVGTVRRDGRMWVTVIFEAATNPGTRLSMPRC